MTDHREVLIGSSEGDQRQRAAAAPDDSGKWQRSGVSNLIAHRKALEAAAIAISLVARVPAPLKCLANQVIRSASSVPARS